MKNKLFSSIILAGLFVLLPVVSHAATFETNLKYGAKGDEVTQIQEFLTDVGVYKGPITGNFYSLTLAGVKKFQALKGIVPVSGYWGSITRGVANNILTIGDDEQNAVVVAPATTTISATTTIQQKANIYYLSNGGIISIDSQGNITWIQQPTSNSNNVVPSFGGTINNNQPQTPTPMPPTPQVINTANISTADIASIKFDSNKKITIKQLVFQVDDSYNPDGYTVVQVQASLRNYPTNGSDRVFSGTKDSNGKITINMDASTGFSATVALVYGQQGTAKNQAGIEKGFRVVLVGNESIVFGEDGSRLSLSDMEFLTN